MRRKKPRPRKNLQKTITQSRYSLENLTKLCKSLHFPLLFPLGLI